jgi:hypothetical protein
MAKNPAQRTPTARQFGEELQKALHNQTIDRFEPARIEPRIRRVRKALEEAEYEFAGEILGELEAEGHVQPELRSLRHQVNVGLRSKTVARLLDGARRRFEQDEYPLALQKVDEVLRVDPGNEQALSLRSTIEAKSKTEQISNWLRLASDHLNNYRFGHARQALQDVLRLRSTDSSALQMFSEVDRREAEYLRQKQEKDSLYRQALDCWKRGEVSSALTKLGRVLELDRQAPDLQVSSEAISYQSLYSQVRSEHEALRNAHAEARKLLSEANFEAASSICSENLKKYPDNALFEALRFELEEKERQYISSYIGKIDRDVESEVDLDRKVAILSEAGRRYPNENHFKERLESVSKRRDLVLSIVQKARNFEDRGEYSEALSQWDILRTIYSDYPGIQLEIERVGRRRDNQLISDAKARWVEQIDHALHSNDFVRALELLKLALSEFPEDPELTAQERIAQKGAERSQEAVRRFDEAQALYEQNPVEGLYNLRAAYGLDNTNPVIRASFVEALLRRASGIIDSDSSASESLIREVLTLEPSNVQARNLQRILSDRNQESGIQLALSNSRLLEEQGRVDDALQEIENGLAWSRSDSRLNTRRDVLLKRQRKDTVEALERDRDVAEMRDLTARFQTAKDSSAKDVMLDRSRSILIRHKGDPDIEAIFQELESIQNGHRDTVPSESVEFEEQTYDPPAFDPAASLDDMEAVGKGRVDLGRVTKAWLSKLQDLSKSIGARNLGLILVILGFAIAGTLVYKIFSAPTPVSKAVATMAANSSVAGAEIYVNNVARGISPQKITLEEGEHVLEARLPGHRSVPATFRVSADANLPAAVNLELEPLPATLSLLSQDFTQAKINDEPVKLQDGVLRKGALSDRFYRVELSSLQSGPIVIEFESEPGAIPVIRLVSSASVSVSVISYLEDKAEVRFAGDPKLIPTAAGITNARQPVVDKAGKFEGLVRGSNVVELETAGAVQPLGIDVDASPGIAIVIGADLNLGNLKVMSPVEGARVSVVSRDRKVQLPAKHIAKGSALFVGLPLKDYDVTVDANGYSATTGSATVVRGKVSMVLINLNPIPKLATLVVTKGTPGATIRFGGTGSMTLDPTGNLTRSGLEPGIQVISISKDDYETKEIRREFVAGETLVLSDTEALLVPYGSLTFNVTTPANPTIGYRPDRSPSPPVTRVKNDDSVKVSQGRYTISIESPGFESRHETVLVTPGKETVIGGTLKLLVVSGPAPAPPVAPKPAPRTEKDLSGQKGTSNGWTSGVDILMLNEKVPGDYSFTLKADKGVASFYLNCSDRRSYVEYVIRDYILRTVTPNSGLNRAFTLPENRVPKKDVYPVRISILERQARIFVNDKLVATDQDLNFLQGGFCFPPKQGFKDFKFEEKR